MDKRFILQEIHRISREGVNQETDPIAEEAPLEIRLSYTRDGQQIEMPLAVTMRTPGDDFNLTTGFLYTEGIIQNPESITKMEFLPVNSEDESNLTRLAVQVGSEIEIDPSGLQRHFYAASSCGICGKASMDLVCQDFNYLLSPNKPLINSNKIFELPDQIRQEKNLFSETGGVHTAWLFDADLNMIAYAEDVGRHNAMDKLIGKAMKEVGIPLRDHMILLSGRISFELVQKAMRAGVAILLAFGAASSGAVRLAEVNGMTLAGFLKKDKLNIYTGYQRIVTLY